MHLRKHDLLQMDDEWLNRLPAELLLEVSRRLLHDVKELQDRLNQHPENSSRPPTSQAPWAKHDDPEGKDAPAENEPAEVASGKPTQASDGAEAPVKAALRLPTVPKPSSKKAGKQPGNPGYGRKQKLAVTGTCDHRPENCTACARALSADAPSKRYTAWDEINMAPPVEGRIGLMFLITRHYLLETNCDHCDHVSRAQPWRSAGEYEWERVELGEWRLVGPQLAGLIVFLALRLRLSRPRIREALMEMFGLLLIVGVIDETLREAGRASFPLEDVLVADLLQEPQLHVDETSWPENRLLLWLWTLVTPWTVLFVIGPRHAEMLENVLQDGYYGILISEGYRVYRAWLNRLRCWPHLIRKLRGLAESSDGRVSGVGQEMEGLIQTLEDAIYAAPPHGAISARSSGRLARAWTQGLRTRIA